MIYMQVQLNMMQLVEHGNDIIIPLKPQSIQTVT